MYQPDVVRSLIRDSGDAIRLALLRRGLPITFKGATADRVSLGLPPMMTHSLKLAGVDLSDLGKAFHYRHGPQDSEALPEALDGWIDAVASRRNAAAAAHDVLEKVAGYPLRIGPRQHEVAPLAFAMYLPRFEGYPVTVGNSSVEVLVNGVTLRLTSRRLQAFRRERLIRHRLNPFDLLTSPFGPKKACGARMGIVYQRLLNLLPDFRLGLSAVVSAAVHAGMADVFTECFDTLIDNEAVTADVTAYDVAISLVDNSQHMPYQDLRSLLSEALDSRQFVNLFGVSTRWAGRTYTQYMREKHKQSLLAIRGDLAHTSRFTPDEIARRDAAQDLLHFSNLIR